MAYILNNDFHLPNVCFNSAYDVVMERCESKTCSLLANKLGELSCMYTKPETLTGDFTAKVLDYIELGWILAWVLNDEADDYRKRNIGKTRVLKFKVTLSCLNLSSTVYILTSESEVITDKDNLFETVLICCCVHI